MLFKRTRGVVGLDIGSSSVKAVELRPAGKGHRVSAVAVEPLPPDSIVDGAIIDAEAVASAIRKALKRKTFKAVDVATSLSGNAVIVKKIALPVMTEQELAESIYWEAEQYIPFEIQDVNLDYLVLGTGEGQSSMDVLLVAAKKDKISDYTGVISQAGRTAVVVDVDAFALQNAYEANYGSDALATVALVHVGASAVIINILARGQSVFTRDVTLGGNSYTEAIQRELGLTFESAEEAKRGLAVDGVSPDDVRAVVRAMTDSLLLEVEKTFDFYKGNAAADRIDRIVLSGGGARIEGFADAAGTRFGIPVERFDPFRQVSLSARKLGVDVADVTPVCAVAVGLALRQVGDR